MVSHSLVTTTGIYRSMCGCDARIEVARGARGPVCPRCEQPTEWSFQRSTYRPTATPTSAPVAGPAAVPLPAVR